MLCPNIQQVKFSQTSIGAIKDIRNRESLAKILLLTSGAGTIANIFAGSGVIEASYNILSTDFKSFASAMNMIPVIAREAIEKTAREAYLKVNNNKEREFWESIVEGCSVGPK